MSNNRILNVLTNFHPFNAVTFIAILPDTLACDGFYIDGAKSGFGGFIHLALISSNRIAH